ncbi:protein DETOXIFICATION 42-like isoform X2 [Wolffia australiana]
MAAGDDSKDPSMEDDQASSPGPSFYRNGLFIFFHNVRNALKADEMGKEISSIAVPAALALAADPLASLVDTALVGHLDAEDPRRDSVALPGDMQKRPFLPSASSALVVGVVLGILQALLLGFAATPFLRLMGVKPTSPMMAPARQYLSLRSIGAPAILFSLAMQGVFRGFKDTKTPLYATLAGDAVNIILDPILIFVARWGVAGAAIAHVISQYVIAAILLWRLVQEVQVIPPHIRDLKFSRFLTCGSLLLARVVAVTFCVTMAAYLSASRGPIPMAAFQVCLQIWLSTSLLADGLAVAGQAILAGSFATGDHQMVVDAASRVLQLSVILGLGLSTFIGIGMRFGSAVFTKDKHVQKLIQTVLPFVAATQPINSLAFVFDGINFGASDYVYSAYSMVVVAVLCVVSLIILSYTHGFIGIWIALTIYISLRMFAGIWRMGAARGPWKFLLDMKKSS